MNQVVSDILGRFGAYNIKHFASEEDYDAAYRLVEDRVETACAARPYLETPVNRARLVSEVEAQVYAWASTEGADLSWVYVHEGAFAREFRFGCKTVVPALLREVIEVEAAKVVTRDADDSRVIYKLACGHTGFAFGPVGEQHPCEGCSRHALGLRFDPGWTLADEHFHGGFDPFED